MKKNILITGGAGFIGLHLCKRLIASGHFVIIVDNFSNSDKSQLKNLPDCSYMLIESDICNYEKIKNEISNLIIHTLVHLAAIHFIPYCNENPLLAKETNVKGTKQVLKLAKEINIKNIIFSSSAAVYKTQKHPLKETDPLKLDGDVYSTTKKNAEEIVLNFGIDNNVSVTILRLFNVYGNNNHTPHLIPELVKRIKASNKIKVGNLDSYRDYVYVDDVVSTISFFVDKEVKVSTIFNVGTGHATNGKTILHTITKLLNKQIDYVIDKKLLRKSDTPFMVANSEKLKSKTIKNMLSTELEDGIRKIIYADNE